MNSPGLPIRKSSPWAIAPCCPGAASASAWNRYRTRSIRPKRRGFAQLKELLAEGVNVSLGNDVIMDPWYLLGKADLVDAAHLALHFTYMSGLEEIPEMLRCATERGARTLGVEDEYGLEPGKPADCVVFDAPDAVEVIRLRATRRWVLRRGSVIAETSPARTTLLGDPVRFGP